MKSHRHIIRSSAIIGGSSAVSVVVGVIKAKVLAVLLGPAGVGLLGIYNSIMGMASTIAGCGLNISGVRQLATTADDQVTLALVRRALWFGHLTLGIFGMAALWLARESVARWVFGSVAYANQVGWLGLGVLLALIAASQTALLQGLRRIGDLAWVTVFSSIAGAAAGILAVYIMGQRGVLWFALAAPAASILVTSYFVARLPRPQFPYEWNAIQRQWSAMIKLGIPLMIAGLLTIATQLIVRSIIVRDLGLDAGGHFQSAWAISMTYISFVLGAMSADYFPRLAGSISVHESARIMVNEQSEMALLLAGPALLAMITIAPWVIELLYTKSFSPAAEILRWQVLGDVLKVSTWPVGFIVLAMGRSGLFIGTQIIWNATYLFPIILGIEESGLLVTGISFWFAYLVQYGVVSVVASYLIGFRHDRRSWLLTLFLLLSGGFTMYLVSRSTMIGFSVGMLSTVAASLYSIQRLNQLVGLREWLTKKLRRVA